MPGCIRPGCHAAAVGRHPSAPPGGGSSIAAQLAGVACPRARSTEVEEPLCLGPFHELLERTRIGSVASHPRAALEGRRGRHTAIRKLHPLLSPDARRDRRRQGRARRPELRRGRGLDGGRGRARCRARRRGGRCAPVRDPEPALRREAERGDDPGGARPARADRLGGARRLPGPGGRGPLLLGLALAAAGRRALVCASDVVVGAPGGARESQGGDAAAAFVTGPDGEAIARLVGRASATMEVLEVWRLREERFARQWEERFIADTMAPAITDTAKRALQSAGVEPASLTTVILDGTNARSMAGLPRALGLKPEQSADPLLASVGRAGTAHAGLLLARALDSASPGDRILVVRDAGGADALGL